MIERAKTVSQIKLNDTTAVSPFIFYLLTLLLAEVPPDILDHPTSTDMIVREGSNVTLKCAATGTPEPTITWRREAGAGIAQNGQNVLSVEASELILTKVDRQHMGAYLCIASNGVRPTPSKRIVLIVEFPPMLQIENQLIGALEGQTLTLECVTEAYPRPITYWMGPSNDTINSKINDEHYKVVSHESGYRTAMKLTINKVRYSDFGSFKCITTNSLGETVGEIKVNGELLSLTDIFQCPRI
ncbi:hypothetical protein QAD02_017981 [Eretmocerus hayati]|uniref:Uncharacterized protein n=1 Tax=Eretmocerus hayati TaxID=131215 RepID=A0ACC2PHX4_9HYME|nr:hypothetical protein QAD02_017981 [Eretmocerus hayati]